MYSEQYKQQVYSKWEDSGFKQPATKEELDIIIELQSRGQKPHKQIITTPKTRNEVKAFHRLMHNT